MYSIASHPPPAIAFLPALSSCSDRFDPQSLQRSRLAVASFDWQCHLRSPLDNGYTYANRSQPILSSILLAPTTRLDGPSFHLHSKQRALTNWRCAGCSGISLLLCPLFGFAELTTKKRREGRAEKKRKRHSTRHAHGGCPVCARCVRRFDDSRKSAIHTTYRSSLRSSSLQEPRYPLLRVVLGFLVFCHSSWVQSTLFFA